MKMHQIKWKIVLTLLFACRTMWAANNELIVDWDGAGTESREPLNVESVETSKEGGAFTYLFDEEISWAPAEGFVPQEGKSNDFSAAISSSMGPGPVVPNLLRLDPQRGGTGLIQVIINGSEAMPPQMRGILFFSKKNFLNGADEENAKVRFGEGSRLGFAGILDGRAPTMRWLVRDGAIWYVSETPLSAQLTYNVLEDRELSDPQTIRWGEYHVEGDPLDPVAEGFELRDFQNITAVGLFWDSYDSEIVLGGFSISRMALSSFSVEAMVVSEGE